MLNVDSEAEIREKLIEDMESFNATCEGSYKNYIGIFTNFLDEYRDNLLELDALMKQQVQIMSASQFINTNNVGAGVSIGSVSLNGSRGTYGNLDLSRDYMQEALNAAASGDLDKAMALLDMRNEKVDIQHGWDRGTNAAEAYDWVMKVYNSRGYAEGIENGPVTETGLVMLHGTKTNPEYVLNSDQAGQLLENLSTNDYSRGNQTASTQDEATATTGITGNARSELEGINKIIGQISSVINQEALTNSQLVQIAEILRMLNETNALVQELVQSDIDKDEARYTEFKQLLADYFAQLQGYLDGYNEKLDGLGTKLDEGNSKLDSILQSVQDGLTSLNTALSGIQSALAGIGTLGMGTTTGGIINTGGSNSSGGSNGGYRYYYSEDYLRDAIDRAQAGDREGAYESLWNRNNKVQHTGENYGTNSSQAQDLIDSILSGRSYAEGIENGPVTKTGLAMLHGTESNPEYVLNSDQAGQLLTNLATQDKSGENNKAQTEGVIGNQTASIMDESGASTGITGNARTSLEGINKIISQFSAMINQEALTNSQLVQIAEILRGLMETNNLLQTLVADDVEGDEERFAKLQEVLEGYMEELRSKIEALQTYLDGYNEKMDLNNENLGNILQGVLDGVEAINALGEEISQLAQSIDDLARATQEQAAQLGSIASSSIVAGGGKGGGGSSGFDFSKDYLQQAIDSAKKGDIAGMNQALQDRDYKVSVTGQNYGKDSNAARQEAESHLKGYAGGLDEGPVTETGPAMLHGTPSEPEYVLSNDQAYNMLDNLTSAMTTEGEAAEVVDDTLATENTESNLENVETESSKTDKEDRTTAQDMLFDEAGTAQTGNAKSTLQGINVIITQISALINQQALSNSQLVQANTLISQLLELGNLVQEMQNMEAENNAERFEQLMEVINTTVESWSEKFTLWNDETFALWSENQTTALEGQNQTNEYMLNILDMMTQEMSFLQTLVETVGKGISGSWYITSDSGGEFNGGFGGSGGGSGGGYGDDGEGGGGGGRPDESDYQTGWYDETKDYLQAAIDAAKAGKTDEAYEALLRRSYKIIGQGYNGGISQSEAVQQIKDILSEGGYNTESSLGDSGVYDADRYLQDVADYEASQSRPSSSSGGGSSRPNYGGYDSRDDFNDAIHNAYDQAASSGQNVSIGNSGLYIDASKISKSKSYASGLENGPVTYTGMAMLHGSPSNPEFVLNSDQAYNILRNMATSKATEFETEGGGNGDTNYVVQGDIILKTDTSPEKFWDEVTKSMNRRWNTSKNNKRGR